MHLETTTQKLLLEAEDCFSAGYFADAAKNAQVAGNQQTNNLFVTLATCSLKNLRYNFNEKAFREFAFLTQIFPKNILSRRLMGIAHTVKQDFPSAKKEFLAAHALDGNDPRSLYYIASMALIDGEQSKALWHVLQAKDHAQGENDNFIQKLEWREKNLRDALHLPGMRVDRA